MSPLDALLRIVLLPAGLVAAAVGIGWVVAPRSDAARGALLAAGLAGGFLSALAAIGVRPGLPLAPSDSAWSWVVWFAAAGAVLGAAESFRVPPPVPAVALRALVGGGATWLLLAPLVPHAMAPGARLVGVAAGGALVATTWTVLRHAAARGARVALAGPVLVASAAASVVLLLYGRSAVMAQAAGALAAGAGAAAALRWPSRAALLPTAAAPVVSLVLVALGVSAYGYLNYGTSIRFPAATALLLVAAAATPVLRRAALAVGASVALAGAAGWLAYLQAASSATPW